MDESKGGTGGSEQKVPRHVFVEEVLRGNVEEDAGSGSGSTGPDTDEVEGDGPQVPPRPPVTQRYSLGRGVRER